MPRIHVAAAILLFVAGLLGAASAAVAQQTLTFSVRFEDKLFINTIPVQSCGTGAVLGVPALPPDPAYAARVAAYVAWCAATSLGENPPTGGLVNPLDARIRAGVDLSWACRAGNAAPVAPEGMARLATAGGIEGPAALGIKGIDNPTALRDQILANGTWGAVFSGHPNPLVEPGFQVHRARGATDIWQRLSGTIRCATDAQGRPTSTVTYALQSTAFPSHKVWYRTPANAAAAILSATVAQGSFSNLWFLPAVPAP
jgi:hypothetical protein